MIQLTGEKDGSRVVVKYLVFLSSMILLLVGVDTYASDETHQRSFVKSLHTQEYYFRAITEALRFIFDYPNSPHVEEMKILIADSYSEGGDEEAALRHHKKFLAEHPTSNNVPLVHFKVGKLYAKNRMYSSAMTHFENILSDLRSSPRLLQKAQRWTVLLSLLLDVEDNHLKEEMHKYGLSDNPEVVEMVKEYGGLHFKSPKAAGTLALLPGAGHLYLNRKRDAVAALLLNGLFIWGAVAAFENDNVGLGIALLVFESGWYGGNIYGAVNGAHKHNRNLKDSFRNRFSMGLNLNVSRHDGASPHYLLCLNYSY